MPSIVSPQAAPKFERVSLATNRQMNVDDPDEPILVEVKDWNFTQNITMGTAKIYLAECKAMEPKEMQLKLEGVSRGSIFVTVTWCPLSTD